GCGAGLRRGSVGAEGAWVPNPPPPPIGVAGPGPAGEGSSASSGLALRRGGSGKAPTAPRPASVRSRVEWGTGQRRWRLLAACDTPRMREEEIFRAIAVRVAALDYRDQVFVRPGYLDADGGWVLTPSDEEVRWLVERGSQEHLAAKAVGAVDPLPPLA